MARNIKIDTLENKNFSDYFYFLKNIKTLYSFLNFLSFL